MARGTTLGDLITKLRISARYDPSPAQSQNMLPLFQQTIRDVQERLYDEFDWPHLKVQSDKTLAAGQRYYDVPTNMNLERIIAVDTLFGALWEPVERGISLDNYNGCNSDTGQRRDPVERWDVRDTGTGVQVEIWPMPASDGGTVRFSGIRQLTALVANGDRADLDDQLIVLYAAAELLAGKGAADEAKLKLQQGADRKQLLQGRITETRSRGFVLGGEEGSDRRRGYPTTIAIVSTQPGA